MNRPSWVPPGERRIEEMLELRAEGKEPITVMVLRHGANGFRQKAVLLEQNSDGKFVQTVPQEGWKSMATLRLEDGGMFGVYQRGGGVSILKRYHRLHQC